jgi:hypothetical protein
MHSMQLQLDSSRLALKEQEADMRHARQVERARQKAITQAYIYIYIYTCVCVCVCVCIYIYIYIYIYI